jgi:hypothetical protein
MFTIIKNFLKKYKELLFLIAINAIVFHKYWLGISTPPWDFLGGGMVEQFRFYKDGGFFNPPAWYPYAWFGIPEYQMVQDGGWFIPVWLTSDLFGWHPANAARLQAFLILFSTIGMYLLAKTFINQKFYALVAGVLYLFIPVFYSNAQHYSSVRSAALLPWLLYFLHPEIIKKSKLSLLFGSLIVFQTITGSYPGNLIATFYTSLIYVLIICIPRSKNTFTYLKFLVLMGTSGILMGLIRYLPVIKLQESFPSDVGNQAGITIYNLIYLIFPYTGENLPWADPTLRSIYIGVFSFVVLSFFSFKVKNMTPWIIIASSSIFMMSLNFLNDFARQLIPFVNISRFAITDWRNSFNLAIIIIVVSTLKYLNDYPKNRNSIFRVIFAIVLLLTLMVYGYSKGQSILNVVIYGLFAIIALVFIYKIRIESKSSKVLLLALISITGIVFVFANSFTWMTTVKEQNFNIYNNTFTNIQESVKYPLKVRPARVTFLPMPLTAENYKNDQRYNRFWLTGGFGAFGYHNIKDINAYSSLFPRLEKEQDPVIDFLMSKSKQLAVTNLNDIEIQLEKCAFSIGCPNSFGVKIRQLVFDKQSEKFEIDSDLNFVMVQNEIYSPVWKGKICTTSDCEIIESSPALESLRTWELPAGKYTFETYAETPFSKVRWIIFSLGAFLAILSSFLPTSKIDRRSTI